MRSSSANEFVKQQQQQQQQLQQSKVNLFDQRMKAVQSRVVVSHNDFANIKQRVSEFGTYKDIYQHRPPAGLISNKRSEQVESINKYHHSECFEDSEAAAAAAAIVIADSVAAGKLEDESRSSATSSSSSFVLNDLCFLTPPHQKTSRAVPEQRCNSSIDQDEGESSDRLLAEDEQIDEEDEEEDCDEEDEESSQIEAQEDDRSISSSMRSAFSQKNNLSNSLDAKASEDDSLIRLNKKRVQQQSLACERKILFTENTQPDQQYAEAPLKCLQLGAARSTCSTAAVVLSKAISAAQNASAVISSSSKAAVKFIAKRDKKISKITDYLNADVMQTTAKKTSYQQQHLSSNDLANYEELVGKLERELQAKDSALKMREEQIRKLQSQQQQSRQPTPTAHAMMKQQSYNIDIPALRKMVQHQYLENAQLNRKVLKMYLHQSKHRLGEYTIDAATFREQWIDGFEVQDLGTNLRAVEKKIAMYQTAYQSLKNFKPKKANKFAGGVTAASKFASSTNQSTTATTASTSAMMQMISFSGNLSDQPMSSDDLQQLLLQPSSSTCAFLDDDSPYEWTSQQQHHQMSASQLQEEQKRLQLFQISLLEKQREVIITNIEQKKREVREVIKKYQLQYLEENSRFGGLTVEEPWQVLGNRYQLLSLLGKGGFSEVYKAIDLEEFREVAVKVHYIDKSWSNSTKQNYLKHAFREHGIQKELNHPNIVKLYDYIEIDNTSFASVLQFCDGPDLSQYLKMHSTMNECDAKYIVKKILDCLAYLSSFQSKVIHYDLKPQNIIFNKGQIKITDFGLSKIIEDNATRLELTSQGVGTYWYLPPECFGCDEDQAPRISSKVDIWSVGVILFEMVYGQKPFGNKMSQQQILQQNTILNIKEVKFPLKPAISKDCQSFIIGCLKYNQDDRFDINQALSHTYFKKL